MRNTVHLATAKFSRQAHPVDSLFSHLEDDARAAFAAAGRSRLPMLEASAPKKKLVLLSGASAVLESKVTDLASSEDSTKSAASRSPRARMTMASASALASMVMALALPRATVSYFCASAAATAP